MNERGAAAVEYALMAAAVAAVLIFWAHMLGEAMSDVFSMVNDSISAEQSSVTP